MQDIRVRLALLGICLVCVLGSGWVLLRGAGPSHSEAAPITLSPPPALAAAPEDGKGRKTPLFVPAPPTRLYVDVSGAVRRPSLYVLPPGSRVMQALRAAGGPTGEADLNAVNLAEKVTDGQKVFVPKSTAAVSTVPSSPTVGTPVTRKSSTAKAASAKISAGSGEMVALNAATQEQLERLPGVGPGMAGRILAYRNQVGGFEKSEDLMQVPGLGPKKYAKIAPFVTP